uniref:Uncharacterized protein n=1 Tax=Pyxicephalus adspersus TaxID=30357 RepID=A0AAV3B4Q7_PYXAD|nr:TPA: hypothetical protein GDO54_005969 [Pyxicephalus adspersus]
MQDAGMAFSNLNATFSGLASLVMVTALCISGLPFSLPPVIQVYVHGGLGYEFRSESLVNNILDEEKEPPFTMPFNLSWC